MSINMDGAEGYSDFEIQHVQHRLEKREEVSQDQVRADDEQEFEITSRGLDNDELAELVAIRAQVSTVAGEEVSDEAAPGSIEAEVQAGYNLTEKEFLYQTNTSALLDPDGDGTDEAETLFSDTDEVGQIYATVLGGATAGNDTTNGVGGPAAQMGQVEFINYRDALGGGPVLDATDDFVSRLDIDVDEAFGQSGVRATYTLFYDVTTVEGGRPRFGRL